MNLENIRVLSTSGELQGVFNKFVVLRDYYESFEEYLKKSYDEIHEKYPNDLNLGGSISCFERDWVELYPNMHRKSFLITCYSYFEKELFTLCKNLKESNQYSLDITDFDSNIKGIQLVLKYLKKVDYFEISKHNKTKTWTEITNIQKIRNLIIHNYGILDRPDKDIDKAIRKYIGTSFY